MDARRPWLPVLWAGPSLLAGLFCAAPASRATTWLPPIGSLTYEERVELAVSASEAIAVGHIIDLTEEWIAFEPRRWLKGNGGRSPFRVYLSQIMDDARRSVASLPPRPSSCIAFLRRAGKKKWVLVESPNVVGGGIIQIASIPESTGELAVLQAMARQTPKALARRSTLVVVGSTRLGNAPVMVRGKPTRAAELLVDSVIVGTLPSGPIYVHTRFGALDTHARVLLMLRPDRLGAWETVGFAGGVLPIMGDRVEPVGVSIRALATRIRLAVRP